MITITYNNETDTQASEKPNHILTIILIILFISSGAYLFYNTYYKYNNGFNFNKDICLTSCREGMNMLNVGYIQPNSSSYIAFQEKCNKKQYCFVWRPALNDCEKESSRYKQTNCTCISKLRIVGTGVNETEISLLSKQLKSYTSLYNYSCLNFEPPLNNNETITFNIDCTVDKCLEYG